MTENDLRRRIERLETVLTRVLLLIHDSSLTDAFGTSPFQETLRKCLEELRKP